MVLWNGPMEWNKQTNHSCRCLHRCITSHFMYSRDLHSPPLTKLQFACRIMSKKSFKRIDRRLRRRRQEMAANIQICDRLRRRREAIAACQHIGFSQPITPPSAHWNREPSLLASRSQSSHHLPCGASNREMAPVTPPSAGTIVGNELSNREHQLLRDHRAARSSLPFVPLSSVPSASLRPIGWIPPSTTRQRAALNQHNPPSNLGCNSP